MNNILKKKNIRYLVIHCSDTDDDFTVEDIHEMHLNFGWDGIGYHKVIDQKGYIFDGRPEYWVGAHVKGFNEISLGVCLIGKNKFSKEQLEALKSLLRIWKKKYPASKILGHKDLGKTSKTCPNFDVILWSKKI